MTAVITELDKAIKKKSSKNFDFEYSQDFNQKSNPLNEVCYKDFSVTLDFDTDRYVYFTEFVGRKENEAELMAAFLFFSKYSNTQKLNIFIDLKYFCEEYTADENKERSKFFKYNLELLSVARDCKSVTFQEGSKELTIKAKFLDAFTVKNQEISKEFIKFFKKNYQCIFTVHGFTDFLTGLLNGSIKKNSKIGFNTDQASYIGIFFIVLDGDLYYRQVMKSSGSSFEGGGFHGIEKMELKNIRKIGRKNKYSNSI